MLSRVTVLRLRKNTWPQYQNPDPVLLWGWFATATMLSSR
jgi:hypothetical protein